MERRPESPGDGDDEGGRDAPEFVIPRIESGAPRPATILKIADELESGGGEILELFREVSSPRGQAVYPIHLRQGGREYFLEVETGAWEPRVVESVVGRASVLRSSDKADAELRILSAEAVPENVAFLVGCAPAALLQLDLIGGRVEEPEEFAEIFRSSAGRRWGTNLEYSVEYLPLVEELLGAAFDEYENGGGKPPILDELVEGLGCFLGEILRRGGETDSSEGVWMEDSGEWGEGLVLEIEGFVLDPIGKARAFMHEGAGDSISFYASFVLEEIQAGRS